ncbi:MAG: SRPBCC family protein, partial [Actinomycetota bacterium]|nr:SRPBCC family protein [Actinomycetota bacterium]
VGPVGFVDVMVVEVWDPPRRLDLRHIGNVVRGSAGFVIEPLGSRGSRIVWWERIELPFGALGERAWPVVGRLSGWVLQRSLRKLAAVASAPSAASGR